MRIGIDAMGADNAPVEEVRGALEARELLGQDDRLVLVGNAGAVRAQLDAHDGWEDRIEVHHASQVVGMNEPPVESLRSKPDSSIAVLAQMHKEGQLDACISAGNTGAFVAAAQMRLRRLPGVHRPGIAVIVPTSHGPVAVCDVGANVSCRPQHLHQYGIMASVYVESICNVQAPRVGLLSVGEEDAKGNELVKQTRELLREDPALNYIGNVEGRDLFMGATDVMICEGFVGNVVLKLMEGMAQGLIRSMLVEFAKAMPEHVGSIKKTAQVIGRKFDFNEYGGAPLLGVAGICIICHGASDYRAIKNAVRVAGDFGRHRVNQRITALVAASQGAADG